MSYDLNTEAGRKKLYADSADLIEESPALNKGMYESDDTYDPATQEWVKQPGKCFCVVGALGYLFAGGRYQGAGAFSFDDSLAISTDLRKAIGLETTVPEFWFSDIYDWNDALERTKEEVVSALRKAAK